jgi:hypothetical protein
MNSDNRTSVDAGRIIRTTTNANDEDPLRDSPDDDITIIGAWARFDAEATDIGLADDDDTGNETAVNLPGDTLDGDNAVYTAQEIGRAEPSMGNGSAERRTVIENAMSILAKSSDTDHEDINGEINDAVITLADALVNGWIVCDSVDDVVNMLQMYNDACSSMPSNVNVSTSMGDTAIPYPGDDDITNHDEHHNVVGSSKGGSNGVLRVDTFVRTGGTSYSSIASDRSDLHSDAGCVQGDAFDNDGDQEVDCDDHVDPDLIELCHLWREGFKVILPVDLGIVDVHDEYVFRSNSDDTIEGIAEVHVRADLSRDEAIDMIDLTELGGYVEWPSGWSLSLAKDLVISGALRFHMGR